MGALAGAGMRSLEAVRELAELTVLELDSTDVVTGFAGGRTGQLTPTLLVCATATVAAEPSKARYARVNGDRGRLVLAIPRPTLRRVTIDHTATRRLTSIRTGLWQLASGPALGDEAIAAALRDASRRLKTSTSPEPVVEQAQRHAEAAVEVATSGSAPT